MLRSEITLSLVLTNTQSFIYYSQFIYCKKMTQIQANSMALKDNICNAIPFSFLDL